MILMFKLLNLCFGFYENKNVLKIEIIILVSYWMWVRFIVCGRDKNDFKSLRDLESNVNKNK